MSANGELGLDRRSIVWLGGLLASSAVIPGLQAGALAPARARKGLRTITYNVLAFRGFKRTEDNQAVLDQARSQMARRMALELALHRPDLVTFQESPSEKLVQEVAELLGMNHAYFPGGYPGTVMTRHKILESTNCPLVEGTRPKDLFTRHWGRALIQREEGELVVYTVHLHPGKAELREREVTEMLKVMAVDRDAGRTLLLQGDLNHKPDGPEYPRWVAAGLTDAFAAKGTGQALTIPSTTPNKRIDYVWASEPLARRVQECRVLFEGAFRTNPEDPRSFALSDHIPVLAVFG
jgi:endonuclease/exonuclease/phosphatase family metal-dependent hydrolase